MTHSQSSGPQPGQDDQGGALVSGVEFWDLSRPPTSDEAWTTHVYLYIYIYLAMTKSPIEVPL